MTAIVDYRINEASLSALHYEDIETILLPPAKYLSKAIASHPDMLMFIGFGRLFCHKLYYEDNAALVDRICEISKLTLTLSNEPTGDKYPQDVLFNAGIIGKRMICNEKTVSRLILNSAQENGYEIIQVPQGYTKCSICVISDHAIITSDKAIARICEASSINVLEVSDGNISLPPYSYGFIGGASGACGDKVYFCGSLDSHPDGKRIKEFCKKHQRIAISLSEETLQDVGSLFFIGE